MTAKYRVRLRLLSPTDPIRGDDIRIMGQWYRFEVKLAGRWVRL